MVRKSLWDKISERMQQQFKEQPLAQSKDDVRNIITPKNTPKDSGGAMGSFGTLSYGGYPVEDYLTSLRGKAKADVYDHMRRSDPQIRMCLSAVKNPIKSANWEIEPADESDESKSDAEFVKHILFKDMDQPWVDFVGESLSVMEFGHVVFEPVNKVVLDNKKFGSYTGIKTMGFRSQRTLERWNLDPDTGDLVSVSQYAYGDLDRMVDIPSEKLIIMSLEKEGANYEGISALRCCYGPWFRKNNYLKLNAIGIEKFAIPTPIVEVPDGKQNTDEFDAMIEALEHYLLHQNNYLTHPVGWKINLTTNPYDPQKVEVSIDNEDKRMINAFLANFLALGQTGGAGSYALSNDLSDFFLQGIEHIASKFEEVINRKSIPALIKMNRGPRENYPTLKHSGISDKAGKELAEILKFLGEGQFIIPDDQTEEHLRKRYGMPKASLLGQRKPAPPPSSFNSPTVVPNPAPITLADRILLSEAKRQQRLMDGK